MNKIEKLIQEYCPDGVELVKLGELVKVLRGRRLTKSLLSEYEKFPVYHGGLEPLGYYGQYNRESNSVMVINVGASAGTVGYSYVDFWSSDGCFCIEHSDLLLSRFIYYALIYQENIIKSQVRFAGIPTLDASVVENINIPIPPLPVQQEIVNILDKFNQLEDELNVELDARRKQYDFYLNQLMGFEDSEVEWKTLGEVGEFIRGNGLQKKDFTETGVGCIHYGQIYTHYGISAVETKSFVSPELAYKLKKAKKGDLIIAATSENVEDVCKAVAWLGDDEIAISGDAFIFTHNQNSKYISYFFQSIFFNDQKVKFTTGTKVIRVSINNLEKIVIPIPPLSEQERIVSILDKFDALVNDSKISIQAEIEARRKQYAYYRNKLLTFGEYA